MLVMRALATTLAGLTVAAGVITAPFEQQLRTVARVQDGARNVADVTFDVTYSKGRQRRHTLKFADIALSQLPAAPPVLVAPLPAERALAISRKFLADRFRRCVHGLDPRDRRGHLLAEGAPLRGRRPVGLGLGLVRRWRQSRPALAHGARRRRVQPRRVERAARSRRAERLALPSSVRRPIRAAPTSKTMPSSLSTRPAAPVSAQQLHRSDVRHTVQAGVRQCGRIFCRFSAAAPRPARENSEKKHESRIP